MGRESGRASFLQGSSEDERKRWERLQKESCFGCVGMGDWDEWKLLFRLRGSVIPKSVLFSLPSAIAAVILHILITQMDPEYVQALQDQKTEMWSSVMFVLGVLIVFRTNQAYSRYWEGATLLLQVRGEWFNAASSIVSFCSSDPERAAEVKLFQHQMVRFMSLLFCTGLQQVAFISDELLEIIDVSGLEYESMDFLSQCSDRSEVIIQWIQRSIILSMEKNIVSAPAPVLSRVFQELSRGSVIMQNVRKIAEIPFPFPYTQMIMVMLIVQTLLMPFVAAVTSATAWWAGVLTFISVLAFWSLNYIAAEIEQPFGEDFNDLPIQNLMKDMNKSLRMLLLDFVTHPPDFEMIESDEHCDCVNAAQAGFGIGEHRVVDGFAKRRRSVGGHSSTGTVVSVVSHVTSFAPDKVDFDAMRNIQPRFDRGFSRTGMAPVPSGAPLVDEGGFEDGSSFSWTMRGNKGLWQASRSSISLRSGSRSILDANLTGVDWCQDPDHQIGQRQDSPGRMQRSALHVHPTERTQSRIAGGRSGRVGLDNILRTNSISPTHSHTHSHGHTQSHSYSHSHSINNSIPSHHHSYNNNNNSSNNNNHENSGGSSPDQLGSQMAQTHTFVLDSECCFPMKIGATSASPQPGGGQTVLQAVC